MQIDSTERVLNMGTADPTLLLGTSTPDTNSDPKDDEYIQSHPCDVVEALLRNILDIYKKYEGKFVVMKRCKEFYEFTRNSLQLGKISLLSLQPPAKRSFWINLYNMFILHLHVQIGMYAIISSNRLWDNLESISDNILLLLFRSAYN